jgi:hypothetical protein
MIESKLLNEEVFPHRQNVTCWFNAWMHDDAPNLGTAFAAMVAKEINCYRSISQRLFSPLPSTFYSPRERWRRRTITAFASILIVAIAALIPNLQSFLRSMFSSAPMTAQINSSLSGRWASAAILVIAIVSASRVLFGAAQAAARFVDSPQTEAAKGSMQSVRNQLAALIGQATRGRKWLFSRESAPASRLIIFVDDLERCRPPRAVDVCEVANQLLSVEGVVIVMIADMQAIATSATMKYLPKELVSQGIEGGAQRATAIDPLTYGRAYLEKMIQIQFTVPVLRSDALRQMLATADRYSHYPYELKQLSTIEKEQSDEDPELTNQPKPEQNDVALTEAERSADSPHSEESVNSSPEFVKRLKKLARIEKTLGWLLAPAILSWIPLIWLAHLPWWTAALISFAFLVTVGVFGGEVDSRMEQMTGRETSNIDNYIREISEEAGSIEELRQAVQRSSAAENAAPELVNQRIQSFLVDESDLRRRAESIVSRHVPVLPRSAKRTINQLRVALAVAERRGMFAYASPLQPEHLGKWVVLAERWPEFAAGLTLHPDELSRLESLDVTAMKSAIFAMDPRADNIDELCGLLSSQPRLHVVWDNLVRFEPWPLTGTTSVSLGQDNEDEATMIYRPEDGDSDALPIDHLDV